MLLKNIGRNVVFLGIVSGLTDISSEMLYPIMPLFLTAVLGAPMTVVGLIEGVAEATASLLKAASGLWSDRAGRRKPFVLWGYGLSAASKPLLALAGAWPFVLFCRFLDRTGKGVRGSARDALLASSTEPEHWGQAFGFHRAMDTAGAVAGPLLTVLLLSVFGMSYRGIFLIAAVPAALGVVVLAYFVEERRLSPDGAAAPRGGAAGLPARSAGSAIKNIFTPDYTRFFLIYGLFAVGNSSDAFLLLKAKAGGLSATAVVLAYVLYNAVYALAATPAGVLADRIGRSRALALGLAVFALVYLGFAWAGGSAVWLLFPVYGLYGALAESSLKAALAERCTAENRAAAMGLFQGAAGILALVASVAAGWLWSRVSPAAPFYLGAACAAAAAGLMALFPVRARSSAR
ncbi:MAG: MFS transporter [Elusimicrobia bacterium]|nr:MFS transporter [Elusimicrobiota bacterium]